MTPITSKQAQNSPWPESIDLSNRLFVEADQLSEAANALLNNQSISAQTLREFSELKRRVDQKYLEACQKWVKTKSKLNQ